ncbi:hypothetical protein FOZ63_004439, partial [Perkinsus olseni]
MKNATTQARLITSVRRLTKDFQRLRVRVESYRGPIGDSLAAAFWELILESPMCLREMRRICIGRQMALSDEETSSCSSDSDRSSSQSTQDHGFVRRRAVHHQRARREVRVPPLPLGVRADPRVRRFQKQPDLNSPECVQTKTSGPAESRPPVE